MKALRGCLAQILFSILGAIGGVILFIVVAVLDDELPQEHWLRGLVRFLDLSYPDGWQLFYPLITIFYIALIAAVVAAIAAVGWLIVALVRREITLQTVIFRSGITARAAIIALVAAWILISLGFAFFEIQK